MRLRPRNIKVLIRIWEKCRLPVRAKRDTIDKIEDDRGQTTKQVNEAQIAYSPVTFSYRRSIQLNSRNCLILLMPMYTA